MTEIHSTLHQTIKRDMMLNGFMKSYVCTAELVMMLVSLTDLSMDTDSRIPSSTVG